MDQRTFYFLSQIYDSSVETLFPLISYKNRYVNRKTTYNHLRLNQDYVTNSLPREDYEELLLHQYMYVSPQNSPVYQTSRLFTICRYLKYNSRFVLQNYRVHFRRTVDFSRKRKKVQVFSFPWKPIYNYLYNICNHSKFLIKIGV